MTEVKFKRLAHAGDLPLPSYETAGAAGMDIRAAEEVFVYPGDVRTIATGFAVEVPPGHELQVRPRSGLAARKGITVLNTPGTIDEDFRGELQVILINHGRWMVRIEPGDRIAQLVLAPVVRATVTEVSKLSSTERGSNGFGSTGQ